jgi:hypothetical protein
MQQVTSVFLVSDFTTGEVYREFIEGTGQEAISHLRTLYPRFTKFVLEGFEVEGNMQYLNLK